MQVKVNAVLGAQLVGIALASQFAVGSHLISFEPHMSHQ